MASDVSPPPMAWRYCGNQVKLWREHAGVTRERLADEAGYGYETVKSMEQGRRRPTQRLLLVADGLCGAQGKLTAAEAFLVPEKYPTYAREYMRYEAEAIAVNWYESQYVPGLLQSEPYVRTLLSSHWPPLDEETLAERVAARLERQLMLDNGTRSFSFVVEESALRSFSDPEAHREQLRTLLARGRARNITIQVMPADRGLHPGLHGPFVLLETAEHQHLVYEEGQTTGVLYADPARVSIVMRRHDMITRQALGPEESARLIDDLAERS
ncbi:Scr1 family TA system antitoxin-like transcriptional regulator [Actinacidiphila glaucinigra]|uniref:helix-turn-helix domain-containing protein n=1 Tax=Actinacidiphila glaucinigra TaxID=235986 RepID=UPI0037A43761